MTTGSTPTRTNRYLQQLWPIYFGYLISQLGNWMFRAGVVYDIYDKQGGSTSTLGWTIILVYVPILIGGKILSPLADRFSSRKVLIGIDLLRALLLVPLLFEADFSKFSTVLIALAIIAGLSFTSPLFTSAQSAYIRRTIAPERVGNALAVISNIDWISNLFGTIFGALLLLWIHVTEIVWIDLITFLLSIGTLTLFLQKDSWQQPQQTNALENKKTSSSGVPNGWMVLTAIFFLNLGAGVINLYPNIMAHDIYDSGSVGLSYIYLGNGIGGFLGALAVIQVKKRLSPMRMIMISSALIALSLFGMSQYAGIVFSSIMGASMLFFGQIFGVGVHTYLLTTAPPSQAGKTTGLFMFATFGGVAGNALAFTQLQSAFSPSLFSQFLIGCAVAAILPIFFLIGYENRRTKLSSTTTTSA